MGFTSVLPPYKVDDFIVHETDKIKADREETEVQRELRNCNFRVSEKLSDLSHF